MSRQIGRLGNLFERDKDLAMPAAPVSAYGRLMRGRVTYGGIRRLDDVEVGFATPKPPYICRDVNGRWRNAHEFDLRDAKCRCFWCGKQKERC